MNVYCIILFDKNKEAELIYGGKNQHGMFFWGEKSNEWSRA